MSLVTKTVTVPPPVLGWNTKDPISDMDPLYCLDCKNFIGNGATVDLRNGYRLHSSGVSNDGCYGLFELALQSGTRNLVAIGGNGRAYNATAAAAATDISGGVAQGTPIGAVNFRNLLFMKSYESSLSPVYTWSGSGNIAAAVFTGPGGDDLAICQPTVYKNRIYFCGFDASIWYGGVDAITGALTQFDFQSVLTKGGRLLYAGGSTKVGDTNSQYFVAISDCGEVLLYSGSYPGSATWEKVGHYYMPPPIGYRSFFEWGSNLVIITNQGVVLLSDVISGQNELTFLSENIGPNFNDKISGSLSGNGRLYANGVFYPKGNCLIINLLTAAGVEVEQYVYYIPTKSWWRWTGIDASSWAVMNNELYFGTITGSSSGVIFKADNGYFDESLTVAAGVKSRAMKLRPAYNYFDGKEREKTFQECIPIAYMAYGDKIVLDADVDFADTTPTNTVGEDDPLDTTLALNMPRLGLRGVGQCASMRIEQTTTVKRFSLQAYKVRWTSGGIE